MNAQPEGLHNAAPLTRAEKLLQSSAVGLDEFSAHLRPLQDALQCATDLGTIDTIKAAAKLSRQLVKFEPSITMIGQIKSGKTTLVNAMIGWPDLLPADVNPWTSVVTSLHLTPCALSPPTRAKFRFFDTNEWDRLVKGGGRIGELADRAGADDELATIMEQARKMREKAKARLGRKFELLLGNEQSYGYFDKPLVARYVCLGDDDMEQGTAGKAQGYFADITKSADLYMQQRAFPVNLCIRDTPGVNDTFMVREQITIKAIRDSRICVVVLSAHQALSSTDLALIRLISNVKSREVIIFVNRIDELSDPGKQVPQIRKSIDRTLRDHQGPADATVIFGSALWAHTAATGSLSKLPKASQEALFNWAETTQVADLHQGDAHGFVWELSGVPALFSAISNRIVEGEGRDMAKRIAVSTGNLLNGIIVNDNLDAKASVGNAQISMPPDEIENRLNMIHKSRTDALRQALDQQVDSLRERAERSHHSFLARATDALAKHLEMYGENSPWSYDPAGLRILLNSAYKGFGIKMQAAYDKAAQGVVADLRALFGEALQLDASLFEPGIPPAPHVPPPVGIGQTIALDLRGSWWKGWWNRRQGYDAQAQRFHDLIKAETEGLVMELVKNQAMIVHQAMVSQLDGFIHEQLDLLRSMTSAADKGAVDVDQLLGVQELEARDAQLTSMLDNLQGYTE